MKQLYFPHECDASSDPKTSRIIRELGMEGYGVFWRLLEILYRQEGRMAPDYDQLSYDIRVEPEKIKRVVEGYGLFQIDEQGKICSEAVDKRLLIIRQTSEARSHAGTLGGYAKAKNLANAKQMPGKPLASAWQTSGKPLANSGNIKENKIKENKIKKEGGLFEAFWTQYPRKTAKPSAQKSWGRIGGDGLAVAIMAGLERHKLSLQWQKDDGQFIPHPATFLNQRRWEDDVTIAQVAPLSRPVRPVCSICREHPGNPLVCDACDKMMEQDRALPLPEVKGFR